MYSEFLKNRKEICLKVIDILEKDYQYVSILGNHIITSSVNIDSKSTNISPKDEIGFVIKVYNKNHYSEFSFDDIKVDELDNLINLIRRNLALDEELTKNCVKSKVIEEEELTKVFGDFSYRNKYNTEDVVKILNDAKSNVLNSSPLIINTNIGYSQIQVSKCFYSAKKKLEQFYTWTNCMILAVAREENNIKYAYNNIENKNDADCLEKLDTIIDVTVNEAISLLKAKPIIPGVYDVITDPSITGLIAHEAFGHGVEMDMFVKNRALAKDYIGKEVASPLVEMHDGAKACLNVASYYFDDDGILASDTVIIKDGILQTGISDLLSALQLNTTPTGNGRRESFKRKSYSRMTNTFFSPGKDKLEDMIKSIKYGFYISKTDNGMEDPKNWGIQCVAQYGKEIVDGKFTGNIVSPVVISGYVPDLLKSITMISDQFIVTGGGHCGKGYKEWVQVCDGGPHLKAKVKLG